MTKRLCLRLRVTPCDFHFTIKEVVLISLQVYIRKHTKTHRHAQAHTCTCLHIPCKHTLTLFALEREKKQQLGKVVSKASPHTSPFSPHPCHCSLPPCTIPSSLHPSLLILTSLPLTPTHPKVLILQRVWRGTRVRLWLKRTKAVTLIALKFRCVCPY